SPVESVCGLRCIWRRHTDGKPFRDFARRVPQRTFFHRDHEVQNVPASLAREAMKSILRYAHVERIRAVALVNWTPSAEFVSTLPQLDLIAAKQQLYPNSSLN